MMSNIEVAEFIRKKIASNLKPPAVSAPWSCTLVHVCLCIHLCNIQYTVHEWICNITSVKIILLNEQ